MPRYHLKIKGRDLRGVRKDVPIAVRGRKRSEATVELRAKNGKAAKDLVKARLPAGSDVEVGDPVKVED